MMFAGIRSWPNPHVCQFDGVPHPNRLSMNRAVNDPLGRSYASWDDVPVERFRVKEGGWFAIRYNHRIMAKIR